jgi:hypothetical protein
MKGNKLSMGLARPLSSIPLCLVTKAMVMPQRAMVSVTFFMFETLITTAILTKILTTTLIFDRCKLQQRYRGLLRISGICMKITDITILASNPPLARIKEERLKNNIRLPGEAGKDGPTPTRHIPATPKKN